VTCADIREAILEADSQALRGEGTSAVAQHVQSCLQCRRLAERIVAEETKLRGALAGLAPRASADDASQRAAREARRRLRRRRVLIAGLAAAAIGGLALWPRARPPLSPPAPVSVVQPFIQTTPDQNIIVYQTANPDIVVVWLYQRNGS